MSTSSLGFGTGAVLTPAEIASLNLVDAPSFAEQGVQLVGKAMSLQEYFHEVGLESPSYIGNIRQKQQLEQIERTFGQARVHTIVGNGNCLATSFAMVLCNKLNGNFSYLQKFSDKIEKFATACELYLQKDLPSKFFDLTDHQTTLEDILKDVDLMNTFSRIIRLITNELAKKRYEEDVANEMASIIDGEEIEGACVSFLCEFFEIEGHCIGLNESDDNYIFISGDETNKNPEFVIVRKGAHFIPLIMEASIAKRVSTPLAERVVLPLLASSSSSSSSVKQRPNTWQGNAGMSEEAALKKALEESKRAGSKKA